jgi:hypothetical protein
MLSCLNNPLNFSAGTEICLFGFKKYLILSTTENIYSTDCASLYRASMVQRFLCCGLSSWRGNAAVLAHALDLGLGVGGQKIPGTVLPITSTKKSQHHPPPIHRTVG